MAVFFQRASPEWTLLQSSGRMVEGWWPFSQSTEFFPHHSKMDQGFYIFVPRAKIEGEKVESRVLYSKKVKSEVLSVGKGLCEMSTQVKRVLDDALRLPPIERAELVEKILESFSLPQRQNTDSPWSFEVEERIEAYERGELKSESASAVFERIQW